MALEFLSLKYTILSSKNDKLDYFTLNTLDLFIQNHQLAIEEDTEVGDTAGSSPDDENTSDRIIYLLYKLSDSVRNMSNPVFEEWKEMLESLTQEYEK